MSRLGRVATIARRQLGSLTREKTIVLALLVQLFVAAFSSFLVVGLTSLYDPSTVEGGGVEAAVTGDAADELVAVAAGRPSFQAATYRTESAAAAAFERGHADALVVAEHRDGRIAVDVTAPRNSLRKTLVVAQVRDVLEALERRGRRERSGSLERQLAPLPPEVDASPYFGFSYTVLVPLLVFLPVFISGSVAVDSLTEEIERGTLELLRVAPVSLTDVVAGKGVGLALLAPAQAALWLGLLRLNGIGVANVPALLLFVVGLAAAFVAFGLALAMAESDRQRAQLLYSLSALAFFGVAAAFPQHPATTVALLAVDSATVTTVATVGAALVAGAAAALGVGWVARRVDAERL